MDLEILNIQYKNSSNKYDLHSCPSSMQTAFELRIFSSCRMELEIFNIQSEQQHQRDDNLRLANLHSYPPSAQAACELRICSSLAYGSRDSRFSTFYQNSSNKETTTYDSPISIRFCRPWELLANCKFARVEVTHLGHQNQKKVMH